MRWLLSQYRAGLVTQVHINGCRQTDAQWMLSQLIGIDMDTHRYTLHDLDPVTRRILRGQQGECAASTGTNAVDGAAVFHAAAIDIRFNIHRLTDAHFMQLGFLEVGINPQLIERNDRH